MVGSSRITVMYAILCIHFVYVCMYVCMYVCTYVRTYVCMYVRMYVCMYVCMLLTYMRATQSMHIQKVYMQPYINAKVWCL